MENTPDFTQLYDDDPFYELLNQIAALHQKKRVDYGSETDGLANVRASQEWGVEPWVGALVRLNDKVHRLQQFARKGELANESAEDSMLDISVYALIALILYREANEGLPDFEETLQAEIEKLGGVQRVRTSTDAPKHAPCLPCQTQGYESAGQDPALD